MRKIVSTLCFTILLIFGPIVFGQEKGVGNRNVSKLPSKEKRWALIIGVDSYQKDISPLYGTVNDARALRETLIKYAGFADERIILMTTDSSDSDLIPTRGNIIDQLDKLQRVVPEDGLILFSFSGHGVSIGSDAFIVPSDGRIYQNLDLMRERAIDVLRVKQAIQATKVKQVIMFLDACRNDPVRAKGDVDNNLTAAYAKGFSFETKNQNIEAYATLYATSFGDRAYEFLDRKTGKYRGYFSYAIEEGLKGSAANDKGEITLAGLIRYIGDTVKERVRVDENKKQIPYLDVGGSFTNGDLVIAVGERNTPITTEPNLGERAFWGAIENSTNTDDFRFYIEKYPNGIFKNLAELKIRQSTPSSQIQNSNESGSKEKDDHIQLTEFQGENGKYGYKDQHGTILIPPKYDQIRLDYNWWRVQLNGKWGVIGDNYEESIPIKFDDLNVISEELAGAKLNGKWGFIDRQGKETIPFIYDEVGAFSDDVVVVAQREGKNFAYGYVDKSGKVVIPLKFKVKYLSSAYSFSNGLAAFFVKGKIGFIDKKGNLVIPAIYEHVETFESFSGDVTAVSKDGKKWGFIDKEGNMAIPFSYDDADNFSEDLAAVKIRGKWGFIDKKNNFVITPDLDNIYGRFYNGMAVVMKNGKQVTIDKKGNPL